MNGFGRDWEGAKEHTHPKNTDKINIEKQAKIVISYCVFSWVSSIVQP